MPIISSFEGINIRMNPNEHNPPHFHAEYQGVKAVFDFEGNLLRGLMPQRQTRFILAWIEFHKDELKDNWEKIEKQQPLSKIDPLRK